MGRKQEEELGLCHAASLCSGVFEDAKGGKKKGNNKKGDNKLAALSHLYKQPPYEADTRAEVNKHLTVLCDCVSRIN